MSIVARCQENNGSTGPEEVFLFVKYVSASAACDSALYRQANQKHQTIGRLVIGTLDKMEACSFKSNKDPDKNKNSLNCYLIHIFYYRLHRRQQGLDYCYLNLVPGEASLQA